MPIGESANEHLPCHSCADYVLTLYEATQSRTTSKFTFANHSKRYLDQVAAGLNSVPPGYVFGIHNGQKPPAEFLAKDPGSHGAERISTEDMPEIVKKYSAEDWAEYQKQTDAGKDPLHSYHREAREMQWDSKPLYDLKPDVREFYHGCDPHTLVKILTEGFRPTLGEGVDEL